MRGLPHTSHREAGHQQRPRCQGGALSGRVMSLFYPDSVSLRRLADPNGSSAGTLFADSCLKIILVSDPNSNPNQNEQKRTQKVHSIRQF